MIEEQRTTKETRVRAKVAIGTGKSTVTTTVPFLDHMMGALSRYAAIDLDLTAEGDLRHHIIEDVAITLGGAIRRLAPPTAVRYADRTVPMDDALVQAVLDLGGRPYYRGPLPSALYDHWMRSFCDHAGVTLHVRVLRGSDRHHIVEAAFKALGFALRDALADGGGVASTKGVVRLEQR
ncbi:MAG TPA: imidazoleglycerol-phosphate dehydratase [Gemmatimonadaceae bacterium]|nr:imidazoleglycerol-phosphate dehydratase [Gemmatimonadaceae bacterium]